MFVFFNYIRSITITYIKKRVKGGECELEKKRLRAQMKERLSAIDETQIKNKSAAIHESLLYHPFWKQSRTLGITLSTKHEIDTRALIEQAWSASKQVVAPKCLPKSKTLDFRQITAFHQLEAVFHGLMEPVVDMTRHVDPSNIDLIVVPGLCFDERGFRIGYGGGYYDRLLSDYKGIKLAMAYDEQLIKKVPDEKFDVPVDVIFTPTQVIYCSEDG